MAEALGDPEVLAELKEIQEEEPRDAAQQARATLIGDIMAQLTSRAKKEGRPGFAPQ